MPAPSALAPFGAHLARWRLVPDGVPVETPYSRLLPVRRDEVRAMLKIAREPEERHGAALMVWWDGDGAARVLAHDADALLLERVDGGASLAEMARSGRDDEASRAICGVAARLHAPRDAPPRLVPLRDWFAALDTAAAHHGGVLARAADVARRLLDAPRDVVVLHGDLHHDNVLDGGPTRGWLAIDPKGLLGERGFDFANVLCNPDATVALAPGRLARQASVIADAARLDRVRLLQWVLAYAGLSAAWTLDDGDDASLRLGVAVRASIELGRVV